jgi:hypothetical protein
MPKPHTFPTLFDEVKTISISFLTKHSYLKPNQLKAGSVHWSRNGENIGSISIKVCTYYENSFIEFDYKCNQQPVKYTVQLVSALSNLGKGFVWFFICPRTGKRCRKLYLADTYFYHRSAFRGCMYEKQTQSKKNRYLNKALGAYFETDQLYEQLYKKHLKKQYAGKPTKKYLKLTQQIQKAESITYQEIEGALLL